MTATVQKYVDYAVRVPDMMQNAIFSRKNMIVEVDILKVNVMVMMELETVVTGRIPAERTRVPAHAGS